MTSKWNLLRRWKLRRVRLKAEEVALFIGIVLPTLAHHSLPMLPINQLLPTDYAPASGYDWGYGFVSGAWSAVEANKSSIDSLIQGLKS